MLQKMKLLRDFKYFIKIRLQVLLLNGQQDDTLIVQQSAKLFVLNDFNQIPKFWKFEI